MISMWEAHTCIWTWQLPHHHCRSCEIRHPKTPISHVDSGGWTGQLSSSIIYRLVSFQILQYIENRTESTVLYIFPGKGPFTHKWNLISFHVEFILPWWVLWLASEFLLFSNWFNQWATVLRMLFSCWSNLDLAKSSTHWLRWLSPLVTGMLFDWGRFLESNFLYGQERTLLTEFMRAYFRYFRRLWCTYSP